MGLEPTSIDGENGATGRNRTDFPRITNALFTHMNFGGITFRRGTIHAQLSLRKVVPGVGVEPTKPSGESL